MLLLFRIKALATTTTFSTSALYASEWFGNDGTKMMSTRLWAVCKGF